MYNNYDQYRSTLLTGSTVILTGGYIPGGRTNTTQVLGSHDCQDFPLPVARSSHVAVNTGSDQIVCGGLPSENYKSCLKFNYISKTWEDHSTLLQDRVASSSVTVHDRTYILGGSGDSRKTSEYLTVGQNTWTVGPDIPGAGVYGSCAVSVDDTIVIIGGYYNFRQVIVYDVTTDQWTYWPSLTDGLYAHDCILTPQGILVTGGVVRQATAQTMLIDSTTGHQQTVGPLTTPRYQHKMVTIGSKVFVVGGFYRGDELASIDEWFPSNTSWVRSDLSLDVGRYSFGVFTVPVPASVLCN